MNEQNIQDRQLDLLRLVGELSDSGSCSHKQIVQLSPLKDEDREQALSLLEHYGYIKGKTISQGLQYLKGYSLANKGRGRLGMPIVSLEKDPGVLTQYLNETPARLSSASERVKQIFTLSSNEPKAAYKLRSDTVRHQTAALLLRPAETLSMLVGQILLLGTGVETLITFVGGSSHMALNTIETGMVALGSFKAAELFGKWGDSLKVLSEEEEQELESLQKPTLLDIGDTQPIPVVQPLKAQPDFVPELPPATWPLLGTVEGPDSTMC